MDAVTMLKVMALGLSTVFSVLVILILVIGIINKVLNKKKKGRDTVEPAEPIGKAAEQAPAEEDDSLVAAIMAAVCACLHTSTHNFRVRSIREHRRHWGRMKY